MRLEDIGFYTLSVHRAAQSSIHTPLYRCELILTDRCNFLCPYCRPLREDCRGDLPFDDAEYILDLWIKEGLRNVRFSGGEPTLYQGLRSLVHQAQRGGVERIAVSTNGSAKLELYECLIKAGVNDFSISLDACCASTNEEMCGVRGVYDRVVNNIRELAKKTYVTVGVVLVDDTAETAANVVKFASSLGVADIRVIPATQVDCTTDLSVISQALLARHPILQYRAKRLEAGVPVRGMTPRDSAVCHLVVDDMAVAGDNHFPCIIYLREGGAPIGKVSPYMRFERHAWMREHDTYKDKICKNNCLDVCVAFNNKARTARKNRVGKCERAAIHK